MTQPIGPVSSSELPALAWRKSSFSSGSGGQCVEVARFEDGTGRIAMRHSQHPDATAIVYTHDEWRAFVNGVHQGEFDL